MKISSFLKGKSTSQDDDKSPIAEVLKRISSPNRKSPTKTPTKDLNLTAKSGDMDLDFS